MWLKDLITKMKFGKERSAKMFDMATDFVAPIAAKITADTLFGTGKAVIKGVSAEPQNPCYPPYNINIYNVHINCFPPDGRLLPVKLDKLYSVETTANQGNYIMRDPNILPQAPRQDIGIGETMCELTKHALVYPLVGFFCGGA